jgi:prepilin-type processing-associated H-X9-DG protein
VRKRFDVIELLVVVAIVASVAVILAPVFATSQTTIGAQKCESRGKKLVAAMLMYMSDHDGRFASAASAEMLNTLYSVTWTYNWPGDPYHTIGIWRLSSTNQFQYIQLAKYVKDESTWICGGASNLSLYGLKFAYGYRCSWTFLTRQFMYEDAATYPDTAFQTETRLGEPKAGIGRTLTETLASDVTRFYRYTTPSRKIFAFCYALGPDVACRTETYAGSGVCEPPLYPHGEGSIYFYADGHASWRETGCGWAPVGYTNAHIDRSHQGT